MEELSGNHHDRREAGVTLVETLVAVLILSFVAVSTLAMFSQGMALNASGVDYNAITNIAKDKSEELLGKPYLDPELLPDVNHTEPFYVSPNRPPVDIGLNLPWYSPIRCHSATISKPTCSKIWPMYLVAGMASLTPVWAPP